jgi:3D (Asp-Asp-Asp) domain-containing protein
MEKFKRRKHMDSDPGCNSRLKNAGAACRGITVFFLLAAVLGLHTAEGDRLSHQLGERIKDNMVIELARAVPVTIVADGKETVVKVAAATVGEALSKTGLQIGADDRVEPAVDHVLQSGDTIRLTRITRTKLVQQTEITYREIRRGNAVLDRGESRVVRQGVRGIREDTVEVTLEDGIEVRQRLIASRLIRPKQDRIVEYGENNLLSRGGRTISFTRVLQMEATAYCPGTAGSGCPFDEDGASLCTGRYNDGYTATGRRAVAGNGRAENPHIVAVDPQIIPLGSRLYIEGKGFALAADVGGAIVGNRIDILFDRHEAARNFGRRTLRVYLLP